MKMNENEPYRGKVSSGMDVHLGSLGLPKSCGGPVLCCCTAARLATVAPWSRWSTSRDMLDLRNRDADLTEFRRSTGRGENVGSWKELLNPTIYPS